MDRAEFLSAVAALSAGVVIGCGSDDPETSTAGTSGPSSGSGNGSSSTNTGGTTSSSGGAGGSSSVGGFGGAGGAAQDCNVDTAAQITCRHGHVLIVTAADLSAGTDKTYSIEGTATHTHMVTVTAVMFDELKQGMTVEIFVPSAVQSHTVFIKCDGLDPTELDLQDCN